MHLCGHCSRVCLLLSRTMSCQWYTCGWLARQFADWGEVFFVGGERMGVGVVFHGSSGLIYHSAVFCGVMM